MAVAANNDDDVQEWRWRTRPSYATVGNHMRVANAISVTVQLTRSDVTSPSAFLDGDEEAEGDGELYIPAHQARPSCNLEPLLSQQPRLSRAKTKPKPIRLYYSDRVFLLCLELLESKRKREFADTEMASSSTARAVRAVEHDIELFVQSSAKLFKQRRFLTLLNPMRVAYLFLDIFYIAIQVVILFLFKPVSDFSSSLCFMDNEGGGFDANYVARFIPACAEERGAEKAVR